MKFYRGGNLSYVIGDPVNQDGETSYGQTEGRDPFNKGQSLE